MTDPLDRLIRDLARFDASARVGALDEKNASHLHWAEFGTRTGEPPRPTVSIATDKARASIERAVAKRVGDVFDGKSSATGRDVLQKVGGDLAEQIQETIDSNVGDPLAKSTLAARRRAGQGERTLVASGEMMKSVKVETSSDPDRWRDDG